MSKITDAQKILCALGLPLPQQNEMSALTLLALCHIAPRDSWQNAVRTSLTVTKGIMTFVEKTYRKKYAPNTRETFRRQVLHQFVQGHIADYNPDNPSLPTNSPRAHYAISEAALSVIKTFGTRQWKSACEDFFCRQGSLAETYQQRRDIAMIPVVLANGKKLQLSPGKHNLVQVAVVSDFSSRFSPGARLLYFGDTAQKNLYVDQKALVHMGVVFTEHDKFPDVVLYDTKRRWLFLIEVVTSHGPMSPKRVLELKSLFAPSGAGLVFVSAFPDFAEFRKHTRDIAWETEVWIAEIPDHLIHYNGDRFLGPR